ncbi:MAG: hypothetical protein RMI49_00175 [Candidatus Caldarchaeum sp.]|nr:hypothetical protein [Candidatus Caldarchaeum sp.]
MAVLRFTESAREKAWQVFEAVAVASRKDPYLEVIAGDGRHCHGYGFAAAIYDCSGWSLFHERFDAEPPLSGEKSCEANLLALGRAVRRLGHITAEAKESFVLLHSRRTRNEPRGIHDAHPFKEDTLLRHHSQSVRAEIYLCHNGGVNKQELSTALSVENPQMYTDSHLYLKYLVSRIFGCDVEELPRLLTVTISKFKGLSKSALNLGILVVPHGLEPMLMAVGCVIDKEEKRWNYYEPVLVSAEGLIGCVSSTVRDVLWSQNAELSLFNLRQARLVHFLFPTPMEYPV